MEIQVLSHSFNLFSSAKIINNIYNIDIIVSISNRYSNSSPMKYCLSQGFSPSSFETKDTFQNIMLYLNEAFYVVLGFYIIWKMCQLCKKAFSYSNFHIHQAYKFYTLALISTIMILASRAVQLEFADKVREAKANPETQAPFRKDPYYQGWVLFNEVMGIISIYTVNLMYALNSLTLLMVTNKCDFNRMGSNEQLDADAEEQQARDHQFYIRIRNLLLYFIIPGCMLFSIFSELAFTTSWCIASRTVTMFSNLLVYLLLFYAFLNIFLLRYKDKLTPLKTKLIWGYIIVAMTFRQCFAWMLAYQDFHFPSQREYTGTYTDFYSNLFTFWYGVFITSLPIFLLSFQADKQLQIEKQELDKSQRIIYSSTII